MPVTQQRTDINIAEFRKLLEQERARISKTEHAFHAGSVEETQDASENELSGYSNFDPADSAEGGAILADRERDDALDENARGLIREIDDALVRIENGNYGICVVTGKPIPVARLRAIPWATMTVEAAEQIGL